MVNTKRLNWLFLITGFADIKSKCVLKSKVETVYSIMIAYKIKN